MICSVFGHRDIENDVDETALKNLFLSLIQEKEVDTFYFGGFGDFDELCHKLITELKSDFPFIRRVYCLTDEKHLLPRKRPRFLQDEDFIFLPRLKERIGELPPPATMVKVNRAILISLGFPVNS